MFAVASSRKMILFFFNKTLAIHKSYFWPTEKVSLSPEITVSSPFGNFIIWSYSSISLRACSILSYSYKFKGSKLYWIVP